MSALAAWRHSAHAERHDNLVHFNYSYEISGAGGAIDPAAHTAFEAVLDVAAAARLSFRPADALSELGRRLPEVQLFGPAIAHDGALASVFSALKFSGVFGVDFGLGDLNRPLAAAERAPMARRVEEVVEHAVARFRLSSVSGSPTRGVTAAGRRTRSRASHLDKTFPEGTLWVTTFPESRGLTGRGASPAQRALALRRALGVPTVHLDPPAPTTVKGLLANLFFRAHFRPLSSAPSDAIRKPTVFSGGFPDVYGSYPGAAPGDGWGRTVTLCAGDPDDGGVGLREAVVSMKNLVCTSVVRLGRVDREDQPRPREALVQVPVFYRRRHHDELGMDVS